MTRQQFRAAYSQVRYFRNYEAGPPAAQDRLKGFSAAHRCWFKREVHLTLFQVPLGLMKEFLGNSQELMKSYARNRIRYVTNNPSQPLPLP